MDFGWRRLATALFAACCGALLASRVALAGPPFMTDDPVPLEYRHSEFYAFSTWNRSSGTTDYQLPAFEYNTSFKEDTMVHVVVPFAGLSPDRGSHQYGLGDVELGFKYRFVHETDTRPQVGIFPLYELPTGNQNEGLGNGKPWWMFPIWVQKSFGRWTTYGGGGRAFNNAAGMRDYDYGGWLLQRDVSVKLTLGGEVFAQGSPSDGEGHSTYVNFGGYYNGIQACGGCSLLFRAGHSVAGQSQLEGYLALYWTWGKDAE